MIDFVLDFGTALGHLKRGSKIAREGWTGKNMYLYLDTEPCGPDGIKYEPVIVMYTAHGKHQPGWLASQADMLAEDWIAF